MGKKSDLSHVSKKTLTNDSDKKEKVIEIKQDNFAVFFIGGAGDKKKYLGVVGPNNNILSCMQHFMNKKGWIVKEKRMFVTHLGYDDVYGESRVAENVIKNIKSKETKIYIVGHSLGGWNGAHLSAILSDMGYLVRMLITLDPVGNGAIVKAISDIYPSKPSPKSAFWVNIRYEEGYLDSFTRGVIRSSSEKEKPRDLVPFFPNLVADFGEQWDVETGADENVVRDINHASTLKAFFSPLDKSLKSAWELMDVSIF
ncbi:hypothetical protein R6242_14710 [Iodobacter sp. CM08]|uniref:hypothetical protein n=1 Tax=Iodobacter sp. CM08 TaxID=3085902 RepID=UPI0029815F37|nr:hypothetical protein [Iodobacter sp. CM08]MDW5417820.1 hypothetical protein [Iodobacter sp. CM08]